MERQATSTEKALELVEQKANKAQCKLRETKLKLVKTASILSTPDKEFTDYKGGEKAQKQTYYNRGFRDIENSVGPVIFQAWKFGFMEGWMAIVNAISLLENFSFRSTNRVPLAEDPAIETQAEKQGEDSSDEEDCVKNPESMELSKQIDSYVVALNDDNPRTTTAVLNLNTM